MNASKPPVNEPNTNAPNLIAVFNEIVAAPAPVLAIGKTYSVGQNAVKVDVVADDGRQWIRVNTIKNSRLLAEFREQDSYLTDSDEDDPAELAARALPLHNSVTTMCEQLLEAAKASELHGMPTSPTVVLRLTRLDGTLGDDSRIARTIDTIRAMPGLVLEQGEREPANLREGEFFGQTTGSVSLLPTDHINLDLSVLVALVSDSTHAPLPLSQQDARARFRVSRRIRGGSNGCSTSNDPNDPPSETHVNALVAQVLQESERSIVQAIAARVTENTKFYATAHARDRCLRIVERIGGPGERRRAQALLVDGDSAAFWSDSRHPSATTYALPALAPLCLLSEDVLDARDNPAPAAPDFFGQAVQTCERIFTRSSEVGVDSAATASDVAQKTGVGKLTVHTVQSFAAGSRACMTTLTANKTSVRAFVREMRAAGHVPATNTDRAQAAVAPAGVWIVDPRSLSETMRVDAAEAAQES